MPELRCLEAKNGFYAESFVSPSDLSKMSQKTNDKMKVLAVIFDNLHAADSYCWDIRDEFSAYARTRM